MDFVEKWGDDVESAVELALLDLKVGRDEVEVTVLEEPSRGFFGIGSKLAKVRVEKIKKEEPKEIEIKKEKPAAPEKKTSDKAGRDCKKERPERKPKRNNDIPSESPEVLEARKKRLEELDFKKTMGNLPVQEDHIAGTFLKDVAEQMGLNVDMVVRADDSNVYVEINGADSGTIIGKRGQTLDAIQYLTSLVVNKGNDGYIKVVVDAENYRAKRERTLEQLAGKLASKAVRTRRTVRLEPMNPYERKVIHATLQDHPDVITRSEGQDPYRKVVIELK